MNYCTKICTTKEEKRLLSYTQQHQQVILMKKVVRLSHSMTIYGMVKMGKYIVLVLWSPAWMSVAWLASTATLARLVETWENNQQNTTQLLVLAFVVLFSLDLGPEHVETGRKGQQTLCRSFVGGWTCVWYLYGTRLCWV